MIGTAIPHMYLISIPDNIGTDAYEKHNKIQNKNKKIEEYRISASGYGTRERKDYATILH